MTDIVFDHDEYEYRFAEYEYESSVEPEPGPEPEREWRSDFALKSTSLGAIPVGLA